jgi:hypothetical protein
VLKIKIKTMFWEYDTSQQKSKGMPIQPVQRGELSGALRLKISLPVRSKSLGVCFNVFFPRMNRTYPQSIVL